METNKFDEWLSRINNLVTICHDCHGKKVILKSDIRKKIRKFVPSPTKPIELVIVGICSTLPLMELTNEGRSVKEWPMGGYVMRAGDPKESWLHTVLKIKQAKSVAIYAECCGDYPKWYKELLQELFPDITFHFLPVPDLFGAPWDRLDDVAEAALRAGIIKISE